MSDMLTIKSLHKQFSQKAGPVAVVDDIDLTIEAGAFITLLGPSGCGKTTTLRMIAGLESPSTGRITIDGRTVFSDQERVNIPVNLRPISMVFQSYAIWPHLNVFQNVAFPLRHGRLKLSASAIKERTEEVLAVVGLGDFAGRDPSALSGGQQQRVALARALVSRPKLLLLDEPLSNLDVSLREQMRDLISELHHSAGLTTIFVTHDQNEAMALSTRIVVMDRGRIVEVGAPQDIFQSPRHPFTAAFVGKNNIFEGRIEATPSSSRAIVATRFGFIRAAVRTGDAVTKGGSVLVYVRPDSIKLDYHDHEGLGLKAVIRAKIYQGSHWVVHLQLGDGEQTVIAHVDLMQARRLDLAHLTNAFLLPDEEEAVVAPAPSTGAKHLFIADRDETKPGPE